MTFSIEPMQRQDWAQVRTIYGEGLATGLAAFFSTPPAWEKWNASHLALGRLVARGNDARVVGWCALASVADG